MNSRDYGSHVDCVWTNYAGDIMIYVHGLNVEIFSTLFDQKLLIIIATNTTLIIRIIYTKYNTP